MTTKKEWDSRDDLRIALAGLLKQEPLRSALEVCLSQDIGTAHLQVATSDLVHQAALAGATREGFFRFYRMLVSLTADPKAPVEEKKPWSHIKAVAEK